MHLDQETLLCGDGLTWSPLLYRTTFPRILSWSDYWLDWGFGVRSFCHLWRVSNGWKGVWGANKSANIMGFLKKKHFKLFKKKTYRNQAKILAEKLQSKWLIYSFDAWDARFILETLSGYFIFPEKWFLTKFDSVLSKSVIKSLDWVSGWLDQAFYMGIWPVGRLKCCLEVLFTYGPPYRHIHIT